MELERIDRSLGTNRHLAESSRARMGFCPPAPPPRATFNGLKLVGWVVAVAAAAVVVKLALPALRALGVF